MDKPGEREHERMEEVERGKEREEGKAGEGPCRNMVR